MLAGWPLAAGGEQSARLALLDEDWPHLRDACVLPLQGHAPQARQVLEGIEQWQEHEQPHLWLAGRSGSELAQAEFEVRQEHRHQRFLRPLLGLVGLWVVLQWGFYLAQGWHLRHEGDRYAAANEALYRELFPQDSKLINLRAQFDQHLAASSVSGQGRLLGMLDQAAEALLAEGSRCACSNWISATPGVTWRCRCRPLASMPWSACASG